MSDEREDLADWLLHLQVQNETSVAANDPVIRTHIEKLKAWRALVFSPAATPAHDPVMQQQMLEDFSDPDFERSLAQIRDVDRHMRTIRALTAALRAARAYVAANHDIPTAKEAGALLYAIDAALAGPQAQEGDGK